MNLKDIYNHFLNNMNIKFDVVEIIKERGLSYVYKVNYDNQDFILKVYRKKIDFENNDKLIEFLNANKINTITTSSIHEIGDYMYVFYPYIDGKHIFKYSDKEINKITDLLSILYNNNLSSGNYNILDKCNDYFLYLISKKDKYVSDDVYKLLYTAYNKINVNKEDFVLVHGDLSNTNLIWNKNLNVIDFDETILAPREYEMCSCIIKNCFDNGIFDMEQAKKIFNSLSEKIDIDYKKFRESWNLYIIKVIIEKLFYLEQSVSMQQEKEKGRDHWSYWYDLLLNERIISELFDYNKIKIDDIKPIQKIKFDKKSGVIIITDSSEKKYIEKKEFIFDKNQSLCEYDLVNMLYNFGLNDLILYNMTFNEDNSVKYFSCCDGDVRMQLSDNDLKKITKKIYHIYDFLLKYGTDHLKNENGDIIQKLYWCHDILKDTEYSDVIMDLIYDQKFIKSLNQEKRIVVLDDLHRENIMFNKDGTITFIDFNGLKKYPKSLQLASLITNLLMLYDDDRIECIIDNWKEPIDYNQLNKLIKYRILKGLAYYEKYLAQYNVASFDKKAITLKKNLYNMI